MIDFDEVVQRLVRRPDAVGRAGLAGGRRRRRVGARTVAVERASWAASRSRRSGRSPRARPSAPGRGRHGRLPDPRRDLRGRGRRQGGRRDRAGCRRRRARRPRERHADGDAVGPTPGRVASVPGDALDPQALGSLAATHRRGERELVFSRLTSDDLVVKCIGGDDSRHRLAARRGSRRSAGR